MSLRYSKLMREILFWAEDLHLSSNSCSNDRVLTADSLHIIQTEHLFILYSSVAELALDDGTMTMLRTKE
jgi:hypothetical protein